MNSTKNDKKSAAIHDLLSGTSHAAATPTENSEPTQDLGAASKTQPSPKNISEGSASANYGGAAANRPNDYFDNQRFRAADLILHPDIHETVAINPDDIVRQENLVQDRAAWMPVPVVEHDGQICIANGAVFVAAVAQFAPEAEIETRFISKAEASALRQAETSRRPSREPMAPSRRALMLSDEGKSHKEISEKLLVTVPRVSQMIALAKTEYKYSALGVLIVDRFATSTRFWSDFYATASAREKADLGDPKRTSPSRVEQFEKMIEDIIADNEMVTTEELRDKLGLNRSTKKDVRGRTIGKPIKVPGTDTCIWLDEARKGGAVFNMPNNLKKREVKMVRDAIFAALKTISNGAGSHGMTEGN